ncbi:MAG TPA: hypothetical protein PK674_00200 [Candidatus Absconditabacterales bacterium]|nr:hypothetical protein [Candidatus Absconditabacterales bacterium]HOQ78783.1 hypothetical protein [Candidatus Absconditabacterales bacterium]HPK27598.1 hypothetical protein [Candidatus Absconditabacterales bacterium]
MLNIKNNNLFILLKFIGAVIIFYLGIKFSVCFVGEKTSIVDEQLYNTGTSMDNLDESRKDLLEKHEIAETEPTETIDDYKELKEEQNEYLLKFQTICSSNAGLCAKIKFQGEFDAQDKYMYLASSLYVLKHIENNQQFGKAVKQQLKEIKINNEIASRRGFAGWDTVTINLGMVKSYVEFLELITHEMGHIVDLGMIRGFSKQKDGNYTEFGNEVFEIDDPSIMFYKLSRQSEKIRKADARKDDFCSSYGMTDPFEDFAECHNLYLNHNAVFVYRAKNNEIMKQKYNFIANLYGGKYLFDSTKDLDRAKTNGSWRPWDTTKM